MDVLSLKALTGKPICNDTIVFNRATDVCRRALLPMIGKVSPVTALNTHITGLRSV